MPKKRNGKEFCKDLLMIEGDAAFSSPLMRPLQNYRGSPVHGGNVRRTKGAVAG